MSSKRKFRTPYDGIRVKGLSFEGELSLTKQSFKDECDVNNVLKRYRETGLFPTDMGPGMYGDFSEVTDFQSAFEAIQEANAAFASLPANIRDYFKNDPATFIAFAEDPNNLDAMVDMGLATKRLKTDSEAVMDEITKAPTPPTSKKKKPEVEDEG